MSNLYLVAHKVRNQPAFDIAEQMQCPECQGPGCIECDDLGYWWIIPTSGHRAYPYRQWPMGNLRAVSEYLKWPHTPMPPDLPDHYLPSIAPTFDLAAAFRKAKAPAKPFPRRL